MKNLISVIFILLLFGCGEEGSSNFDAELYSGNVSTGSSLARITIVNDHIYAVNSEEIIPIDITNLLSPEIKNSVEIGFDLETVYPYNNNLLIGSPSSVYVYGLENPDQPNYLSQYARPVISCRTSDPVITIGEYAYTTIKNNGGCSDGNVLDVLYMGDLSDPQVVSTHFLSSPGSLAYACDHLFICEDDFGLTKFSLENPKNPTFIKTYSYINAYDVLYHNETLFVTGDDGIYGFDCKTDSLIQISFVEFYK